MDKNTKIIIGVCIVLVVLVAFFALSKKQETKPGQTNIPDSLPGEKQVNGYTREEMAQMNYSKEDLDLLFI